MEDFMLNMHMQRTTLFDTFYENLQSTTKKGPAVSRMLYAARTKEKETTKQRVAAYHEEILKKATGNMTKVSGFLTVYPTCCYCCVEAETPHLMTLLKAFQSSALNPAACLEGFCVFSYTEEIQKRAFPSWMTVYVNVQLPAAAPPAEPTPEDDFPDKWNTEVSELNINMLKWSRQLSEMDKNSQTLALESLRATAEDLLPYDPTILMNLMDSPRAPKLDEILAILGQHMTIVFDYDILKVCPTYLPTSIGVIHRHFLVTSSHVSHNFARICKECSSLTVPHIPYGPSRINRFIWAKIVADFADYLPTHNNFTRRA